MYRTVESGTWTDPRVRALSPLAKLLWMHLITSQHTHVSGIYYLADCMGQHETGLTPETYEMARNEIEGQQLAHWDRERELVFVVNYLKRQGRGQKIVKAVQYHLPTLHDSPLIAMFLARYSGWGFSAPDAPSIPHPAVASDSGYPIDTPSMGGATFPSPDPAPDPDLRSGTDRVEATQSAAPTVTPPPALPALSPDEARISRLIGLHCREWERRYNALYLGDRAKDRTELARALAGLPAEVADTFDAIVTEYVRDDTDRKICELRHPLWALFKLGSPDKYRVASTYKPKQRPQPGQPQPRKRRLEYVTGNEVLPD